MVYHKEARTERQSDRRKEILLFPYWGPAALEKGMKKQRVMPMPEGGLNAYEQVPACSTASSSDA